MVMNIESLAGMHDMYTRSGEKIIRFPVSQQKEPIEILDERITKFLYQSDPVSSGIDLELLDQWTASLCSGNVPEGFDSIEDFVMELKIRYSFSYNRRR